MPKLREGGSTPENATDAVGEWTAAARNERVVAPGRKTTTPSAELWEKHANEVGELRRKLGATPYTDHQAWALGAREASAAFGAWSKRTKSTPDPLAAASRELAKATQLRRYPLATPQAGKVSAQGATMIILAATPKSDRPAYALMFGLLAATAKAIHDMYKATFT